MNASRFDFTKTYAVLRNADLAFSLVWAYNNVPIDLTGHTLQLRIYTPAAWTSDGAPVLTLDNATNGGITIPTPTNGKAFYLLTQAKIAASLAIGVYRYVARDLSGGATTGMFYGDIEFAGGAQ